MMEVEVDEHILEKKNNDFITSRIKVPIGCGFLTVRCTTM